MKGMQTGEPHRGLADPTNIRSVEDSNKTSGLAPDSVSQPATLTPGQERFLNAYAQVLEQDRKLASKGAEVLAELAFTIARYVCLPSDEAKVALTLWIAATHAQTILTHAPRLVVKSPLRRCGKTRLLEILSSLVYEPFRTANASAAALVRSILETDPPTLILDEFDTIFRPRRGGASDREEDLRGILNSGHSRGWPYVRWNNATGEIEECSTFAMAALGGIGDLPDTIEDRAIIIVMRRRAPGETIAPFRTKKVLPVLDDLRGRLSQWVRLNLDELQKAEPKMPVEDRAADTWEPLIAIADLAGGEWPQTAREACRALTGNAEPEEATLGERLLFDLFAIYNVDGEGKDLQEKPKHLASAKLVEALVRIPESPWRDLFGKPIDARGIAKLLRNYEIRSKNLKEEDGSIVKGYSRESFEDAWSRYVRYPATNQDPTEVGEGSGTGSGRNSKSATQPLTGENDPAGSEVAASSASVTAGDQERRMLKIVTSIQALSANGSGADPKDVEARLTEKGLEILQSQRDLALLKERGKVIELPNGRLGVA